MNYKCGFLSLLFYWIGTSFVCSQTLLDLTNEELSKKPIYALSTFKTTRISIAQSIETRKKGVLEIHLMNRFWNTPEPSTQSFIADKMSSRIGLNYGITNKLTAGIGGTTWNGIYDGSLKYRLTQQQINGKGVPLSITFFQNASYRNKISSLRSNSASFTDRLSFTSQILIARKITTNFSFQMSPSFVYRNSSMITNNAHSQFALGFGGRYKVGHHVSIVSEYFYLIDSLESTTTFDAFTLGVNWEVGDLLLQFQITNSKAMGADAFITQTKTNFNFKNGNLHFGFNATYVVHFIKSR
jgi:hypothetical protein